jgi:DNA-directed RNA polymerase subunit H (RpoH/RPB5)
LSIYKSRETLLELLAARGFAVEKYMGYSKNEIDTMARNGTLDMMLMDDDSAPTKKMYIKYALEKPMTVQELENIMEDLYENAEEAYRLGESKDDGLLIVTSDEPNKKLQGFVHELYIRRGRFVTIFNIKRLQFNVTKHELQPHSVVILTDEERDEMMRKYNIKGMGELPEISRFDPLAMALFVRPGQICKMMRNSPTALVVPYYRVCV